MKFLTDFLGRLFDNPKPVRWVLSALVLAILVSWATQCRSAELFVEAGSTYARGETPVIILGYATELPGLEATAECSIGIIGSSVLYNTEIGNQAFGQCKLWDGFKKFDLGIGVAYLQNVDFYNGSHLNFSLGLRYRFTDRLALEIGHFSNAGTQKPNLGRDMVLIQYKF